MKIMVSFSGGIGAAELAAGDVRDIQGDRN